MLDSRAENLMTTVLYSTGVTYSARHCLCSVHCCHYGGRAVGCPEKTEFNDAELCKYSCG